MWYTDTVQNRKIMSSIEKEEAHPMESWRQVAFFKTNPSVLCFFRSCISFAVFPILLCSELRACLKKRKILHQSNLISLLRLGCKVLCASFFLVVLREISCLIFLATQVGSQMGKNQCYFWLQKVLRVAIASE